MDFRLDKLRIALWIIGVGMVGSLLYHGWQGWVLGKGYPYNTFLCFPQGRYDDFTNSYRISLSGDPYNYPPGGANYFPAAFLIFEAFAWLPPVPAAILFLNLCTVGLFVVLNAALRPLLPQPGRRMIASIILLWTYPFVYCLDRGNNEILLVLLVACSLFFFSRKKFTLSFLILLPAICFKLYPAIFLLLFFRQRLFHWFFGGILGFLFVSWIIVLTFPGTVYENYEHFAHQLFLYNQVDVLGHSGVAASASAWNLCRLVVWMLYFHFHHTPAYVGSLPLEVAQPALQVYYAFSLSTLVVITLYVLFVETNFARRAILLLLYTTVAAPGGADYKTMYLSVALTLLILVGERRSWDLVVTCLLAFCLLPKREVFITWMGRSDTGYFDASLVLILNPLCMLLSIVLIVISGWTVARPFHFQQALRKVLGLFRFAGLRSGVHGLLDAPRAEKPHPL